MQQISLPLNNMPDETISFFQHRRARTLAPPAYVLSVENGQATYAKQQLEWDRQGVICNQHAYEGATDLYATAGLINCHLHWLMLGGTSVDQLLDLIENHPEEMLERALHNANATLKVGITSGCDKGAPTYSTAPIYQGLEDARNRGALVTKTQYSPYMLVVSNSFADEWCVRVEDQEDLNRVQQQLLDAGAGIIKIVPEMDYLPEEPHYPWVFSQALFENARNFAQQQGWLFSVHGKGREAVQESIKLRVDSIEHGLQITPDDLLAMQNRGIWLGCTIEGFECRLQYAEERGKSLTGARYEWEKCNEVVTMAANLQPDRPFTNMLFASDAGSINTPHASLRELYLLRKYGYSPEWVLEIATRNGAKFMRKADQIGSLDTGKMADVVYWLKNPLELSLEEWEHLPDYIVAVVSDGKLVSVR